MTKRSKQTRRARVPSLRRISETRGFEWGVAAFYALVLFALFFEFVTSNLMLYGSDTVQSGIYMKSFYMKALKSGNFPEWSPYLFGGMPWVDAFHSDLFYPFALPFGLLLPIHRALGWVMIAHFYLGGLGMFWAAHRGWGISRIASAVCGLAYMLAPYFVTMVLPGHAGRIFVVAWFPIGFLLLKRIWDHPTLRDMGLWALAVGMIILTPHVQMAYYSLWAYAGYSVYRLIRDRAETGRWSWVAATGALVGVFVALGISAIQFYPSYNYIKNHSPRSGEGLSYETAASWSLHAEDIVNCFVPEFSGRNGMGGHNSHWGRNKLKDRLEYGGLVVLLLAIWGVSRSGVRDRWFFVGLALFGVLFALGGNTPLFSLFYHVVPLVKVTRAPAMIMFLYVFGITLLAGFALDSLEQQKRELPPTVTRPLLLWSIAGVLGFLAVILTIDATGVMAVYQQLFYPDMPVDRASILAAHEQRIVSGFWWATILAGSTAFAVPRLGRNKSLWVYAAIVFLIVFDHVSVNRNFIEPMDHRRYTAHNKVLDFLSSRPKPLRLLDAGTYLSTKELPDWVMPMVFYTNYFALHGVAEFTGYHGNQLRTYTNLLGGGAFPRIKSSDFARLLDVASVGYVLYARRVNRDGDPPDSSLRLIHREDGLKVYENTDALDYVRLVSCWELRRPDDTLFSRLFARDFDLEHCVLIDSAPPFSSTADTTSPGDVRITSYGLESVTVEVTASRPALLVLADNSYPSWHATSNGKPVPIITTNGTFRGVPVTAGDHVIEFSYRSSRLRTGAWITLLSSLLAIAAVVVGGRGRSRFG